MDIKNNEIYRFYYQQLTQTPLYNTLYLNTVFTKKCNFNCSYCSQNKEKDDKILDLNIFEKVLKKLLTFKNIDKYIFSIMGGELSLLDLDYQTQIFEILKSHLSKIENKNKKIVKIVYVTNFSTDFTKIYNEYFKIFKNECLLDLAISHHHQNEFKLFNKVLNDYLNQKIQLKRNIIFTIKTFNYNSFKIFNNLKNKYQADILIEFGDLNWKIQKKIFSKIKKFTRPVICNAWNYNLDNSGVLCHLCTLKKIDLNKLKQKPIFCNKRCSNYEIEQDTFKKIISKHI